MSRYLTPAEKAREIRQIKAHPPDARPGAGSLDAAVIQICDAVNAIDGLCTVQSCAGHVLDAADGSGKYVEPGCLWLRMDERRQERIWRNAHRLATMPGIERLDFHFIGGTDELVLDVRWLPWRRADAMHSILDFLHLDCGMGW